jgi:uncharacterized membrane protein YfcA
VFTAVQISPFALEVYIGVLVLLIGIIVLLQRGRKSSFSWKSIFAVGIIGAFNKGMTGGGYVPLVTGGQIIGGREAKSSVGSTTVSIAVLCAVGFLGYLLAEGVDIDWKLAGAACIGAVMIAPLAALTTKRIKTDKLKIVIGLATILLGTLTLVKVFVL